MLISHFAYILPKQRVTNIILTFVLLVVLVASCNESITDVEELNASPYDILETDTKAFVLGKKLDNPYSLQTMRQAYKLIKGLSKSTVGNDTDFIQATHLYVRFSPQTEDEYDLLTSDSLLDVYSYPLDYEILSYEGEYHDPELPDSVPTYQYAAVPYGYVMPKVQYVVLDSLYIPYEGKDTESHAEETLSKSTVKNIWYDLEEKALEITNNLSEEDKNYDLSKRASKWRPNGYVYFRDDKLATIPMQGVKVRARRFFTTHHGITDANGKYECDGTFRHAANYYIRWDRADFKIKDGWASDAKYDGPNRKGGWNVFIIDREQLNYAAAFYAAYYYYYEQRCLPKPPSCNIRVYQYKNHGKNGNFAVGRKLCPFTNAIHVYYNCRSTNKIFGSTIHELTHAMHWDMSNWYNSTDDKLKDTWATGVAYDFSVKKYGSFDYTYHGDYTGLVEDLITKCGFDISFIGTAAMSAKTWNGFKQNIKSSYYAKNIENRIDSVFAVWN